MPIAEEGVLARDKMSEPKLEAKTRWKIQIEQRLANGNFAEAMTLVHKAFAEFADDPEFLALEEKVMHGRERSVAVFQMMEEGRQLCREQNFEGGQGFGSAPMMESTVRFRKRWAAGFRAVARRR